MGQFTKQGLPKLAILGLWAMSMSAAEAAPPIIQRAVHGEPRQALDLRSPLDVHAALDTHAAAMVMSEKNSEAFPSSLHRQAMGGQTQDQNERPALGSSAASARIDSPMQALARRVHHEGLPVARLWENKSALVSLGLSPKGKPGLWITQKIH
jgi:hypothetical protein